MQNTDQHSEGCLDLPIDEITIGTRHRKGLGNLDSLATDIGVQGLFQRIGVTPEHELVFGLRRLVACRDRLGWTSIPARVVRVSSIARGEFAENLIRKSYTPSERVAIVETLLFQE
jgi:ParB family chromosome partitioning protein